MGRTAAWVVLTLVFVDEVLAVAGLAVWGRHAGGWWLALVAAGVAMTAWGLVASPRAPYGGPVRRPLTQVAVFALAVVGLWAAGHAGWAVALLVFSLVVHGLARLPEVTAVLADESAAAHRSV